MGWRDYSKKEEEGLNGLEGLQQGRRRDYKKVTEWEERVNIVKRLQPGRRRGDRVGGVTERRKRE